MTRRRPRGATPAVVPALAVVLGLALAGCGSGGTDAGGDAPTASGSDGTAAVLGPALDRVDAAVVADSPTRIAAAVAALERAARAGVDDGTLEADRAEEVVAAAEALLAAVPSTAPTPTPAPVPPPAPEEHGHGEEHGPGHGKARGHEKHDD